MAFGALGPKLSLFINFFVKSRILQFLAKTKIFLVDTPLCLTMKNMAYVSAQGGSY